MRFGCRGCRAGYWCCPIAAAAAPWLSLMDGPHGTAHHGTAHGCNARNDQALAGCLPRAEAGPPSNPGCRGGLEQLCKQGGSAHFVSRGRLAGCCFLGRVCRGGLERRGKQETKYLKELEAIAESGITQVGVVTAAAGLRVCIASLETGMEMECAAVRAGGHCGERRHAGGVVTLLGHCRCAGCGERHHTEGLVAAAAGLCRCAVQRCST